VFNRAAVAVLTLLSASACGTSDSTGPDLTEEADLQPTISGLAVTPDAKVYLRTSLKGKAEDPEGRMGTVVIDWGDQSTVTVTSDFDAISKTHDYAKSGTYTVVVTATDVGGNRVTDQATVKLDELPQPCLDIKLVSGCLKIHPDYKGVTVEVGVLGITVDAFTLSTTDNHVEIPIPAPVPAGGILPYPMGKLAVDATFSKTKGKSFVRFRLLGCLYFTNCPGTAVDKRLTW